MHDDLPQAEYSALARIEEAGLNAAQPPEQLLFDGWLLRFSPGKARRARSVQALAAGHLPLDAKLAVVRDWYAQRALPPLVRVTPFSRPIGLDGALDACGWVAFETTRVMTAPLVPAAVAPSLPAAAQVDVERFARCIGALRGSSAAQIGAHAARLQASPLRGATIRRVLLDGDVPLVAGQAVVEHDLAGLYDIVTAPAARGRGLAMALCRQLLADAAAAGARLAYLQVGADNAAARRLYARLGFTDRYSYWYRRPADAADELLH